jgi:hypothetical protein
MVQMEKVADILESVNKDTKPSQLSDMLKPVTEKLKDLKVRADALGEPEKEVGEKLRMGMMDVQMKTMSRVTNAMQKLVASPELLRIVQDAMKDM